MNGLKTRVGITVLLLVLLTSCGGGGSSSGDDSAGLAALSVAVAGSAYSNVIIDCVAAEQASQSCALTTLPVLGQQVSNPTVDDILSRTVISHEWMATRFRQLLERLPPEMLALFKATTAVVISADIRPSYYTPLTGAIYLDPADLWITNAEKATILQDPDYRADFGDDMGFVSLTRYVDGTDYAWGFYPLNGSETRRVSDIVRPMAQLLFHELAHANDFIPPSRVASLDSSLSILDAVNSLIGFSISDQQENTAPLNSQLWKDLAEVLYMGRDSSAFERSLTPQDVGSEFEIDGANDDYAYTSQFEDVAMLFEEVMMKHFYGIERDIVYTDPPPAGEEEFCDSYIVRWGFRARGGEVSVRARAERVLQLMLDQSDVSSYLASLASPTRMSNGLSWCTIQSLNAAPAGVGVQSVGASSADDEPRQRLRPGDRGRRHF